MSQVRSKIDQGLSMTSVAVLADKLVTREETRTRSRMRAYAHVAAEVGRSATWLRQLISGAAVRVDLGIAQRLDRMLIQGLEQDIARLEAELALARQSGVHPASDHVGQIDAHLAAARALLNGGGDDHG